MHRLILFLTETAPHCLVVTVSLIQMRVVWCRMEAAKCSSRSKFRCGKLKQKELMLSGRIIFGSFSANMPTNQRGQQKRRCYHSANECRRRRRRQGCKNGIPFEFPVNNASLRGGREGGKWRRCLALFYCLRMTV